ncbi:protein FAM200B-like [Tachypleus tridentatus]|uniref:protein FAM200B-like n=1 Tax=Tachypleus tridentatus TaxID=6853 RepID=UPI003FD3EB20
MGLEDRRAVALRNIQFGSSGIQDQKLQAAVEASYFVAYKVAEQQKMPHHCRESDYALCIRDGKQASCVVLLGFVRYVHQDKIKEEFLLCEDLLTTTKREISSISSVSLPQMDWNSVQQVSVDGAPSMMGRNRGLRGLIQAVNPEISVDHCIIHRYSLGSKSLPGNLKLVFEDVLKIVNFIKSRDVNSRIFRELCKEMGEQYQVLLYHTDVRWLSRGKVVRRVIELRTALQEFLKQEESPFATKFTDKEWSARLCYLADIFAELNSDNLQLQGQNTTVIDAHHTVTAFLGKLRLWIRRLEKGVIAQFPTLDQFVEENIDDRGIVLALLCDERDKELKVMVDIYFVFNCVYLE